MSDIRGQVAKTPSRVSSGFKEVRLSPDGAGIFLPWKQMLVFEGLVYTFIIGTVTTPIAGHATIDADQPEAAVRVPANTNLDLLPLSAYGVIETGATTLGAHGMMIAASFIDVANGTSTASNSGAVELRNMRMDNTSLGLTTCRHTYSGNGTDPLTAGNFAEIDRIGGLLDSDAATSGFQFAPLDWYLEKKPAPLISKVGSLLAYWEGSTSAMAYCTLVWAEFPGGTF